MRPIVSIDQPRSKPAIGAGAEISEHLDGLYRFALRLTRNHHDAQELTQETVLRAWERKQTITMNARAWMFQTLYHAFVSSRRHLSCWKHEREEDKEHLEGLGNPLPTIIATEDVRRAIEALPDDLRAVVWLSDAEDLHLREIAQVLDCPIGTVASRLWRARLELRKLLSAYGPSGEKQP